MKIWKTKQGEWIDAKEFVKRFKEGVNDITPIQQAKTKLLGGWIVLAGIIIGLIVNYLAHIWWLFIVLIGSLIISGITMLGEYQKYNFLKEREELMSKIEDEVQDNEEELIVAVDGQVKEGMSSLGMEINKKMEEVIKEETNEHI